MAPGELSLRQVRPLPVPDSTLDVTPFFVGSPTTFCTYGSERSDAFAAHRLKTRISLEGRSRLLTPEQLATSLYDLARIEFIDAGLLQSLEGNIATLPLAAHRVQIEGDQATTFDEWNVSAARWILNTRLRAQKSRYEGPVLTFDDLVLDLTATWAAPQPVIEYSGDGIVTPTTRSEDTVELWAHCGQIETKPSFPRVEQIFTGASVTVQTAYWSPPTPPLSSGYTAPIIKWDRTTITGLTSVPIVLAGYYSQTHAPKHHNFGGEYIFEPRLEPGLPDATLRELEAANVAYIIIIDLYSQGTQDEIWAFGIDGTFRRL